MSIFLIGIVHFITPVAILYLNYLSKKIIILSIVQKHPQRIYDIVTIIIAFSHIILYPPVYFHTLNLYSILVSSIIGFSLPVAIWLMQRKRLILNIKLNFDVMVLLPLCAIAEELIWRVLIPYFLVDYLTVSNLGSIFISMIGFVTLHIPLNGIKVVPYITLFTIGTWIIYANYGIVEASIYHIIHNFTMEFVKPINRRPKVTVVLNKSQSSW